MQTEIAKSIEGIDLKEGSRFEFRTCKGLRITQLSRDYHQVGIGYGSLEFKGKLILAICFLVISMWMVSKTKMLDEIDRGVYV